MQPVRPSHAYPTNTPTTPTQSPNTLPFSNSKPNNPPAPQTPKPQKMHANLAPKIDRLRTLTRNPFIPNQIEATRNTARPPKTHFSPFLRTYGKPSFHQNPPLSPQNTRKEHTFRPRFQEALMNHRSSKVTSSGCKPESPACSSPLSARTKSSPRRSPHQPPKEPEHPTREQRPRTQLNSGNKELVRFIARCAGKKEARQFLTGLPCEDEHSGSLGLNPTLQPLSLKFFILSVGWSL